MIVSKVNPNKKVMKEHHLDFGLDEPLFVGTQPVEMKCDENRVVDRFSDLDDSPFIVVQEVKDTSESVPEPPQSDLNYGLAGMINSLIKDEWDAIDGYNSTMATLIQINTPEAQQAVKIFTDIVNEENIHVGQLQKVLELVSPNAISINTGVEEASEQMGSSDSNVLHPGMTVQCHSVPQTTTTDNLDDDCSGLDMCTITDVDDTF